MADFIVVDMFAKLCTGRESAAGAMQLAERQLHSVSTARSNSLLPLSRLRERGDERSEAGVRAGARCPRHPSILPSGPPSSASGRRKEIR